MSVPAAVLFDLDGTLVDSLPALRRAMNALLAEMGRPPVGADELRGWIGDGARALVERCLVASGGLSDLPLADSVKRYLAHYRGHTAEDCQPYPGVGGALRALKEAGHPLGVCTNKPTDLSVELLTALGLAPFFSAIVGGDAVARPKPDGLHVLTTLDRMGAAGHRALMVGDSANDVAAARAAGCPVVVVSFGYSQVVPKDLGADAVIDDFADLTRVAARYLQG